MQYDLARVRELNSAIDPLPVERNGKRGGEGKKKEKGKKCNFGFNGSEKCCGSLCNGVYMYIYIYRGGVFLFFFYSFLYILFFFTLSPLLLFLQEQNARLNACCASGRARLLARRSM